MPAQLNAWICGGIAACLWLTGACAQTAGHDADLSRYRYPFPVERLAVQAQGQALRMAYMDVRPAAPNNGVVVLLHGKNFSGAYWEKTIRALTGIGYRVIAPDQIGFGKSSKPESFQFTFQELATNTLFLLDTLGIDRATIVGHSMGGMVATRFALMFPARTSKLVLVNPIGLEDWKRMVPDRRVDASFAAELKATPEAVRAYMRDSYFGGAWRPDFEPLLDIQRGWILGPDWRRMAWISALTTDMIFTQPVLYEFGDLGMPVLMIIGQKDRTAIGKDRAAPAVKPTLGDYPALARKAKEQMRDATLVELADAGHVPQVDQFDLYFTALSTFLSRAHPR